MIDLVVDTCTLVHANSETDYQESSIELINKLIMNNTLLVVDEGFDLNETTNRSYIGLEYIKHIAPGMLAYGLLQHIALNGRFKFVSNRVPNATKNHIEQIIRNKKDRMFLRVALNSEEKKLISHDYTDYQKAKRKTIKTKLKVEILDASEINHHL
jgi:hypothetical protein